MAENKLSGDLNDKRYWDKAFEAAEGCDIYQSWKLVGERADRLASRRLKGKQWQSKDLVDITGSVADSLVSELAYQDPEPTVRADPMKLRDLDHILEKIAKRLVVKSKRVHQKNARRFLCWGMAALKRLWSQNRPFRVPVRPQDMLFDKNYMENGTEGLQDCAFFRERLTMSVARLKLRAKQDRWNKSAVSEVIDKLHVDDLPDIFVMTDVYETHFRDAAGNWKTMHYSKLTDDLLEKPKTPEKTPPPYGMMLRTGSGGIEEGMLARISEIDERFNKILRRACNIAENRANLIPYDNSVGGKGGTGRKDTGLETRIKNSKNGMVIYPVNLPPGKSLKDVIGHVGIGAIEGAEMMELEFLWRQVWRTVRVIQQELAGGMQRGGRATATEVTAVKEEKEQAAALSGGLVDEYLEEDIKHALTWVRWVWQQSQQEGNESMLDWLMDILDEDEFILLDTVLPTLSMDLHEFVIGIETGSTHFMYNQLRMDMLMKLQQFTMQSPNAQQWMAEVGKRFRIDKMLAELYRLGGVGRAEEWFEDMPQGQGPGTEESGMDPETIMAALTSAGGLGGVPQTMAGAQEWR